MYRAQISSPFGPILLCANPLGLTGLYFADQNDSPDAKKGPGQASHLWRPSAGMRNGVPLRVLRPTRSITQRLPLGEQQLASSSAGKLTALQENTPTLVQALFLQTQNQLREYFAGSRQTFTMPLSLSGTTFQIKIWQALREVSYGQVVSYAQLARMAGLTPGHGRAAGAAVGRNPVSIIVPCHRIIGTNGMLTGYSGGLSRKVALLELEGFELSTRTAAS